MPFLEGHETTHFTTLKDVMRNTLKRSSARSLVVLLGFWMTILLTAGAAWAVGPDLTVTVTDQNSQPFSGIKVLVFKENGDYTGTYTTTDTAGVANFGTVDTFVAGNYFFRAKHLGNTFDTAVVALPATTSASVVIQMVPVTVTVLTVGTPVADTNVLLFDLSDNYLSVYKKTNSSGVAVFDLPVGASFKFRASVSGSNFFSDPVLVAAGGNNVTVDAGGGLFNVTVQEDQLTPISGIKVYLYSADGTYLDQYGLTDANGKYGFNVPGGQYKVKAKHMGYEFWSSAPVTVSGDLEYALDIPHQDITVTLNGNYQGAYPIQGVPMLLYTEAGEYLYYQETTLADGTVVFHLPQQSYKVAADYMDMTFFSAPFTWTDTILSIPMAEAEVSVVWSNQPIADVPVYAFTPAGVDAVLTGTTDAAGKAVFRLPAADWKFNARYQSNTYWSTPTTLTADQLSPVTISTGGGTFYLTVMKDAVTPMEGLQCYVYNSANQSVGESGVTNSQGVVSFDLGDGIYKVKTNYLGYAFETALYEVPTVLSDTLTIQHTDVTVTVNGVYGTSQPMAGVDVLLLTPDDVYLDTYQITDAQGQVTFSLPQQDYKVRARYFDKEYLSTLFNSQNISVEIPMAGALVSVIGNNRVVEGASVRLYSETDVYFEEVGRSDVNGQISCRLPAGRFLFKADYLGSKFSSGVVDLTAYQSNPVVIDTGGGAFTFTLLKDATQPIPGADVYVYNDMGNYLEVNGITDENGRIVFDLADGAYQFKVNYLGHYFYTSIYNVPQTLNDVFTIPHQDVVVTVNGVMQTPEPVQGAEVYLYAGTQQIAGQKRITDVNGQVTFSLPANEFNVRVDYLTSSTLSAPFSSQNVTVDIPMGDAQVTVYGGGHTIQGVNVHAFDDAGAPIDVTQITDAGGIAVFRLPAGTFNFRADYQGGKFWSGALQVAAGQVNPAQIDTGGGIVTLTVLKGSNDPLFGAKCYIYTQAGDSIGLSGTTNVDGRITFDLADGDYKVRVDHLEYPFWSDIFNVPGQFAVDFLIPHQTYPVFVQGVNPGPQPLTGVTVYLYTEAGTTVDLSALTDVDGRVDFLLPQKGFKVKVNHNGATHWSPVLTPDGTLLAINQGATGVLPAVADFTASVINGQVYLTWTPLDAQGTPAPVGYAVYRRHVSEVQFSRINTQLVDVNASQYVDSGAVLAGDYTYYIAGVTADSMVGMPSAVKTATVTAEIPDNTTPVTGLAAAWNQGAAQLSWSPVTGVRFKIFRGSDETAIPELTDTDATPFVDNSAGYYHTWYYRVATIREYPDPANPGSVIQKVGPLSTVVSLPGHPVPQINVDGAELSSDGNYVVQSGPSGTYALQGTYTEFPGDVTVTATNGATVVTGSGSNGQFSIQLPGPGVWEITITDPNTGQEVTLTYEWIVESTPPVLVVDGPANRTANQPTLEITGTATDDSGMESVRFTSNQYPDQSFGAVLNALGAFSGEVPLKSGDNQVTVTATDKYGNQTAKSITITMAVPAVPVIRITDPADGSTVTQARITLTGTVHSSLPKEQIRLLLGERLAFPEGANGDYTFTFDKVALAKGLNSLEIKAETPYGNVSAITTVTYDDAGAAAPAVPTVGILSPLPGTFLTGDPVVSGMARCEDGIQTVTVNGQPATMTGAGGPQVSFQAALAAPVGQDTLEIVVTAVSLKGKTISATYSVGFDTTPPAITLALADLLAPPQVNLTTQQPFVLRGTITETHLAGVDINGESITVTPDPSGSAGLWAFSAGIALTADQDHPITLSARDFAGHQTSTEFIVRLGTNLNIEIISPGTGAELIAGSNPFEVTVTARVQGAPADHQFSARVDENPAVALNRSGDVGNGILLVDATQPDHTLHVTVTDALGATVAERSLQFKVVNDAAVPLEVQRQEPANGVTGAEPNDFIAFYFNKPIDPALLTLSVKETAHGLVYNTLEDGADITRLNDIKLVEVHRDQETVPGGIAHFPGNNMLAFYPDRDFAYGGEIYISMTYDNEEIWRSSFTVRPLPTLAQGFVVDQYMQPVPGIEVRIPSLNRIAITDAEGNYGFGFGDTAENALPGGRHRVVINANLKNRAFGAVERWINVEQGRLTAAGYTAIPILNPDEPFRYIGANTPQALLAGGDLTLNLSDVALYFPDGRDRGDVHVQFLSLENISYQFVPPAVPHWVFGIQPMGIEVTGQVGLTIKMPPLYGNIDYAERIGDYVILVGYEPDSMRIVPIGVGSVDAANRKVTSAGPLHLKRLDYIGYAVVGPDRQEVLKSYSLEEIGLAEMISRLGQ